MRTALHAPEGTRAMGDARVRRLACTRRGARKGHRRVHWDGCAKMVVRARWYARVEARVWTRMEACARSVARLECHMCTLVPARKWTPAHKHCAARAKG